MLPLRTCALLAVLLCGACAHKNSGRYDGAWTGSCGTPMDFVLHGDDGRAAPHVAGYVSAEPACAKPVALTVQSETPTQLVFAVKGSEAGPACPDMTVTLKPDDAGHLTGTQTSGGKQTSCRLTRR